jgi:D-3-phosphoglycerate dehydrogenase
MRVLITDNDLGDSVLESNLLKEHISADVFVEQCKDEESVISAIEKYNPDALIVQFAPITRTVISKIANVKIISRFGIGLDMIDLEAAQEAGISVKNVPYYCTEEVATHALSLALSLWRKIPQFDDQVRSGSWSAIQYANKIQRISNSTIGLIGVGRIGGLLGGYFQALGARVIAVDPFAGTDKFERVDLATLAAESDLISLHCPLTKESVHIISTEFLEMTKKRPILINTSRGGLIDPIAVADALNSGRLSGAGLDVFEIEPLPLDDQIRQAPNTIITPHSSWASVQALPQLRHDAAFNVINYFRGS